LTPGADQAAATAESRSAQDRTKPINITVPFSVRIDPAAFEPPARARAAQLRASVSLVRGRYAEAPAATRLTDGHRAAVPALRAAVDALAARPADDSPSVLAMGCWAAGELLDGDALRVLMNRWKRGSLLPGLLPLA
jgi:hypothetical protein